MVSSVHCFKYHLLTLRWNKSRPGLVALSSAFRDEELSFARQLASPQSHAHGAKQKFARITKFVSQAEFILKLTHFRLTSRN